MNTNQSELKIKPSELVNKKMLVTLPAPRSRDVIRARFGLGGKRETLESVGQRYRITRERVRQIQEDALKKLKEKQDLYSPLAQNLADFIEKEGGLISEERLLNLLFSSNSLPAKRRKEEAATVLILKLSSKFLEVKSKFFNKSWTINKTHERLAQDIVELLTQTLKKKKTALSREDITKISQTKLKKTPQLQKALFSYVDASTEIFPSPFGKWGLVHWPEISPKGARDRAYLVLKQKGQPLHFREISDLINKTQFKSKSSHPAHAQTVHNELIKSDKFVLVGRGTYGLSEWGYRPGTVRDIIEGVIENSKRPLEKEKIIEKVLKQRQVKRNTVVLNLNNKEYFKKMKDGRYALAN